jgi:hypothetical protein
VPDLNDLDHFDQGLPHMDLLPPSEIRRRGNRLRRRRTALVASGGVLAAAIAIGAPVVALSGSGPDRGTDVATAPPSPARTEPDGGWTTTVPKGFPLLAGFADEGAKASHSLDGDAAVPAGCQSIFVGYTDSLVASYQGVEDRETRVLAIFPDAATASAQMVQFRATVEACTAYAGTDRVVGVHAADLGTQESMAFSEQVQLDQDLLTDLTLTVIGRTGNAIYLDSSFGTVGGDVQIAAEIARLTEKSTGPVAALCAYSVDGC